jgi:hypothetical protein
MTDLGKENHEPVLINVRDYNENTLGLIEKIVRQKFLT